MAAYLKNKKVYLFIALTAALFLVFTHEVAVASESFFIDSGFDKFGRDKIQASKLYTGNKAEYYVEDIYFNTLSSAYRIKLLSDISALSDIFDKQIYDNLTAVFGLPWIPGIDNNIKITILFTQTTNELGGYFRNEDGYSKDRIPTSNMREMMYIDVGEVGLSHTEEFLAHELQHLINFNQKTRLKGKNEERWLNELMSEVAPAIAGLPRDFSDSNLERRVEKFLENPTNSFVSWQSNSQDYAAVSIFGRYLYGQFGANLFTQIINSNEVGEEAINEALSSLGSSKTFDEVFLDWSIAILVNDCSLGRRYCYADPDLGYENLHITFGSGIEAGDVILDSGTIEPFAANWFWFADDIESMRPEKHVFFYDLEFDIGKNTTLAYVTYPKDSRPSINFFDVRNEEGSFAFEDFGFKYGKVVVILSNRGVGSAEYTHLATTRKELPNYTTMSSSPILHDGDLAREVGDEKVYIIKKRGGKLYKRWLQDASIMDMYGHLRWEAVKKVAAGELDKYLTSNVIRFIGDPRVYRVFSDNSKRWITTEQEFLSLGYSFDMVYEVNERESEFYK